MWPCRILECTEKSTFLFSVAVLSPYSLPSTSLTKHWTIHLCTFKPKLVSGFRREGEGVILFFNCFWTLILFEVGFRGNSRGVYVKYRLFTVNEYRNLVKVVKSYLNSQNMIDRARQKNGAKCHTLPFSKSFEEVSKIVSQKCLQGI